MAVRLLLTGSTGLLGRELLLQLQNLVEEGGGAGFGSPLELIVLERAEMDFTQPDRLYETICRLRPHIIVNAAAYTAVESAEHEESLATIINGTAVQALAQSARSINALLLHYSTDYVFNGMLEAGVPTAPVRPYKETDPPSPINAYGRSKLLGERYIQVSDCDALIVRTAWLYGVQGAHFVHTILQKALRGEACSVVMDQRGTPTSVRQLAELTCMLLVQMYSKRRSGTFHSALLHATAAGEASWYEFACEIVAQARALAKHKDVKRALDAFVIHMKLSPEPVHESIALRTSVVCNTSSCNTPQLVLARRPAYSVLSNAALEHAFEGIAQSRLRNVRCHWKVELARTLAALQTQFVCF